MKERKFSLTQRVLIGMCLGVVIGLFIQYFLNDVAFIHDYIVNGVFHVGGKVFVASLKMLVVPLVFVSIVCGTSSLNDINTLGRLGGKTLALYLVTTALAISLALFMGELFQPGAGVSLDQNVTFDATVAPSLGQVIIDMVPTNPIQSMANGNTLQIIIFAILFGIAIGASGERGERVASAFEDLNAVIMRLVMLLMNLAPYGVFFLLAKMFTTLGVDSILNLLSYFLVLASALLIHAFVTYSTILKVIGRLNPIIFFKKMEDAIMFAFSTASSNTTIPVTLETVTKRLGVKNRVASFTVPLGATINMDGTAIMQGVATAFIAQAYGIDLTLTDYMTVIMMATFASIGTAGVPGVGLVMLSMVLIQVGLPVDAIGLIMGVDRLLDMIRTAVNISGDATVSCVVAQSEGEFDREVFDNLHAGEQEEEISLHDIHHVNT